MTTYFMDGATPERKMKTFYFNTGVVPCAHNPPVTLGKGQVWKGGTKQIPFDCGDVPEGASFMFACDYPNLLESKQDNLVVRPIHNSALRSKFAYFRTLKPY